MTALTASARRALEEAAARAWPPRETLEIEGWQLRFSGGGSQRANSVQCLHWTGAGLDDAIDAAEAAYRARGLRPIFQVTDIAEPAGLDACLAARGYASIDRTLLMTRSIPAAAIPHRASSQADAVTRHSAATGDWRAIYLDTLTPDRRATAPAIVAALPEPKAFFIARLDGAPAAVGLGVAEPPYCGIECMATRPALRGRGAARAVLHDLELWAAEQGATTLWLQVLEANAPARRLYEGLGFTTQGAYWYRHAP